VLFKPAGCEHEVRFGGAIVRCILVELDAERAEQLDRSSAVDRAGRQLAAPMPAGLSLRLLRELRDPDAASGLIVESLLLELLAVPARVSARTSAPRWLREAERRLHESLLEPIELEQLARESRCSPDHFGRTFRSHFGLSPGQFVRDLRLAWCERRLADSDLPISIIAQRAGFADQSHLGRHFKRRTGLTPARFRARWR
jgi:AraC family transcriptional regulator